MGFRSVLTPDDLKKGDLAPAGWHFSEIVDCKESEAQTDSSANITLFFKVLEGPAKGIQCRRLFNEKALGFAKNLLAALEYPKTADGGYDISEQTFYKMVGAKLEIYIKRGESNKGNEYNDVVDFRKKEVK